jgi:hypothetical protein
MKNEKIMYILLFSTTLLSPLIHAGSCPGVLEEFHKQVKYIAREAVAAGLLAPGFGKTYGQSGDEVASVAINVVFPEAALLEGINRLSYKGAYDGFGYFANTLTDANPAALYDMLYYYDGPLNNDHKHAYAFRMYLYNSCGQMKLAHENAAPIPSGCNIGQYFQNLMWHDPQPGVDTQATIDQYAQASNEEQYAALAAWNPFSAYLFNRYLVCNACGQQPINEIGLTAGSYNSLPSS